MEITLVLGLLLAAVILFSTEKFSPDIISLACLIILVAAGILTPKEAFEGFGSDFIMMLASVFIISAALQNNGIIDLMALSISKMERIKLPYLIAVIMLISGTVSAFMNNTTVAAIFVAPVMSLAKRMNYSPSKLLMPMAFAALLGGTCTLIGTSTNVAGNAFLVKSGFEPIRMFEFLPIGIPLLLIGVIFMATVGRWLLPGRIDQSFMDKYDIHKYLSEIIVLPNSKLIGRGIYNLDLGDINVRILKIIRNKEDIFPDTNTVIQINDLLLVEGNKDDLIKMRNAKGIDILGEAIQDKDLMSNDVKLAEVLIGPYSELVNHTLKNTDFRKKKQVSALAIHRKNYNFTEKIAHVVLKAGDVLLVQGRKENINLLKKGFDLIVINEIDANQSNLLKKGWLTLALFIGAIIVGTWGLLPISIAFVLAAVLCVFFKTIELEDAYKSIEWHLLVLIASMTAFGIAMSKSGADVFLAHKTIEWLSPLGVYGILAGFMVLTVILTQPMSNAAAAMVVLPIAVQTATQLDVNERTFAIAVILSASVSMLTPFEPACILVFSAGQYRVRDFLKIGGMLTLLLLIALLLLLPVFWQL